MKIKHSVRFERLVDDEDENHIANEFPICLSLGCGMRITSALRRDLTRVRHCCKACMDSKGSEHDASCKDMTEAFAPRLMKSCSSGSDEVISASEIFRRVSILVSSTPMIDSDIDINTSRTIFEGICLANEIPLLDEKRFVLAFSRFSQGRVVPKHRTGELFYCLFKKVLKNVRVSKTDPLLARHFLVMKNSKVTRYYRFKSVLGQGSFGIVHKVVRIDSGIERVCKSIPKSNTSVPFSQIESEIRIIATLDHPNIIKIVEYFEDDIHMHLIMEYCADGDLLERIKQSIKSGKSLSLLFVKTVIRQLLSAIAFMQTQRIIHKDLKPENIMLITDKNYPDLPIVKIIDFGLSEIFSSHQISSTTVAGTAYYMSPQIFKPPFSFKADIWSIGVISFFMLTGILPFFGSTVAEVKSNVLYRKIQWPNAFAGTGRPLQVKVMTRELVEKMLEKDEAPRPNAMEALRHPWLSEIDSNLQIRTFALPVALNMLSFSRLSWWKRCMLNLLAHVWEFKDVSTNLAHIFLEIDKRGIGYITLSQMANSLNGAGIPVNDAWVTAKAVDLTHSGNITYTALVASCIYPLIATDKRIIRCLFNCFQPNKRDTISFDGILEVLSLNQSYSNSITQGELRHSLAREFQYSGETRSSNQTELCHIDITSFRKWLVSLT